MYLLRNNPYINERNMFYSVLPRHGWNYEIMLNNGLTESQIILKTLMLRVNTPLDEIDITLQNLYACLVLGNCVRINQHFRAIFEVLKRLLNMRNKKVLLMIPLLLGKIVQTKEMKPSWSRYYEQIIVATVYCFDQKSRTAKLILTTLQFMAHYLTFDMTMNAIYALISYDEDIRIKPLSGPIIFGLRFLNDVTRMQNDKLTYAHVRTLEPILLKLIDDDREIISKWSTYVLQQIRRQLNLAQTEKQFKKISMMRSETDEAKFNHSMKYDTCNEENESFAQNQTQQQQQQQQKTPGLSESEIIRIACQITPDTMPSEREIALRNLSACIEYGNCTLANKHFHELLQMLMSLLNVETYYGYMTVLNVFEKILRSKLMKPNWSKFLREILLKIIIGYGSDRYTNVAIGNFMMRIAYALPLKETLKIIDSIITIDKFPSAECATKLLSFLMVEQADRFKKIPMDDLLQTLVRCTNDTRGKIRLVAKILMKELNLLIEGDKAIEATLEATIEPIAKYIL